MDLHAELDRLNATPELSEWVAGTVQKLLDKARQDAATIKAANLKIQALALELAHHRRIRFGNKSEAFSPEQRELFQETWNTDLAALEAETKQQAETLEPKDRPKRQRAGRQTLPEHLPRIEHQHEPESCTCGQCGNNLVKIGEDISEQLDVEPARFFVHRHIRPQYACRACETVSAAPIPPAVIDGGMASVGLYVWVIIGKYLDHLPLYRLEQIAARDRVMLSRSTLAEWVERVGVALQPLADRLTELLLERPVLHADETPVAQLDPGQGKTKRAYLWAYRSNVLESLPYALSWDDVRRVIATASGDTERDIRDRAILLLLAIYGLRRGEVASLRLNQIDQVARLLHIWRLKRRQPQVYPLVPSVAEALRRYIDDARPNVPHTEVFIRTRAPRLPILATAIYTIVSCRLRALGIQAAHLGPHALRHSCAAKLLADGLTLKEIGDHLGHRSTSATMTYTKIDLASLRQVGDFDLGGLQ